MHTSPVSSPRYSTLRVFFASKSPRSPRAVLEYTRLLPPLILLFGTVFEARRHALCSTRRLVCITALPADTTLMDQLPLVVNVGLIGIRYGPMHLFLLNIVRGLFFVWKGSSPCDNSPPPGVSVDDWVRQPYVLSNGDWNEIGEELLASRKQVPAALGRAPQNPSTQKLRVRGPRDLAFKLCSHQGSILGLCLARMAVALFRAGSFWSAT
jgi:hypothetical protein